MPFHPPAPQVTGPGAAHTATPPLPPGRPDAPSARDSGPASCVIVAPSAPSLRPTFIPVRDVRDPRLLSALGIALLTLALLGGGRRVFTRLRTHAPVGLSGPALQRRTTALQVGRGVLRSVVLVLGGVGVLSQFVNLTPLLAGAGVLGLVVSFGAQSVLKDLVTGTFLLAEGQIAVGDVVEAGGRTGAVEQVSLRRVVLRDADGSLHLVPSGQITTLTNRSRQWRRSLVDVPLGWHAPLAESCAAVQELLAAWAPEQAQGTHVLQAAELLGVETTTEHGPVLRVAVTTTPGHQEAVARRLRADLLTRLGDLGLTPGGQGAGSAVGPGTRSAAPGRGQPA